MKDNAKCFLLNEQNEYIEITYAELKRQRYCDEQFKRRRFIALHGMLLEVTEQDYQDFERQRRRERYLRQRTTLLPEDTAALIRLACDAVPDFETQVLDQILIEKILATMSALSTQECEMIEPPYFCARSDPKYAAEIGLSRQAVHRRKLRMLAKLKNILEN